MTDPLKQATRIRPATAPATRETVRVIYGVHSLDVNIAGRSVTEVRTTLRQALNIAPQAVAIVDGREILESHVLQPGEVLEFVRLAGEKGTIPLQAGRVHVPVRRASGLCLRQRWLHDAEERRG
ncbi:MAG TPA: hypothetical protein VFF51_06920 [Candidatus Methylomirabilis sp.]|nr:hypothetical protein [Candidatus Methylomirabilis sp.]